MNLDTLQAFTARIKEASPTAAFGNFLKSKGGRVGRVGEHLVEKAHHYDLGGLGILAANPAEDVAHQAIRKARGQSVDGKEVRRGATELAGLGVLAAPALAGILSHKH